MGYRVLLVSACGFLCAFVSVWAVYLWSTRSKRELRERLEKVTDMTLKIKPETAREKNQGLNMVSLLGKTGRLFFRQGMTKRLEDELARADIPLKGEEFMVIWLLAALLPGTLSYFLSDNLFLSLVFYLAGAVLPPRFIGLARQKRLKQLEGQLGDALAIMSNALRAGFSFMQAMEMVGREMPDPLAKEFSRTYREVNLGMAMEEALSKMVKRVGSSDLDLLVTAVLIQRQVGGNLAQILDNISHTLRERLRIRGEIKTLTAQGRMSGLIIGAIPPALVVLMLLINPAYIKPLFQSQIGLLLILAGVCGELVGIMIIKKIISIDF